MSEKTKILCVEDEAEIRENMAGILESEGFEVLQASNGQEGLQVFLDNRPDLIISDIMMPELSGYDFLKAVRENKNIDNSNVPFILLSALGQKDDIINGIDLEASDYLVKPVDFDLLIAKIKEKTTSAKKTKEIEKKNIANLKTQVSNIVPQEMLQYVDVINQISSLLKTEVYGPLPHKKYLDDINKIYINSLKLKTIVSNFLSGTAISDQIDVSDEILDPLNILKTLITTLSDKFQSKIKINNNDTELLPNIKINKMVLLEVIRKTLACIFKIDNNVEINISMATDHLDRLMIVFYPGQDLNNNELVSNVEKAIAKNILDSQGLEIELVVRNSKTNIVLSIPNYRVIKKR